MILLLSCGACAGIYSLATIAYCETRTKPPTISIYPNSVLQKKTINGVHQNYHLWDFVLREPHYSLATYNYSTTDTPKQVFRFYIDKGGQLGAYDQIIRGNAEPFGEYFIYADWDTLSQPMKYTVEFRWKSCY